MNAVIPVLQACAIAVLASPNSTMVEISLAVQVLRPATPHGSVTAALRLLAKRKAVLIQGRGHRRRYIAADGCERAASGEGQQAGRRHPRVRYRDRDIERPVRPHYDIGQWQAEPPQGVSNVFDWGRP